VLNTWEKEVIETARNKEKRNSFFKVMRISCDISYLTFFMEFSCGLKVTRFEILDIKLRTYVPFFVNSNCKQRLMQFKKIVERFFEKRIMDYPLIIA
jgi:hypothetical protein